MRTERNEILLAIHIGWINAGLPATDSNDAELKNHVEAIKQASLSASSLPLFDVCLKDPAQSHEARLTALNHAALFLKDGTVDTESLKQSLRLAGEQENQIEDGFDMWINGLPEAVKAIQASADYPGLKNEWNMLIDHREAKNPRAMDHLRQAIGRFFGPDAVAGMVFMPNPLQTPQTGCRIRRNEATFLTSAMPNAVAIRAMLRPAIRKHRAQIAKLIREFNILEGEKSGQEEDVLSEEKREQLIMDCFARGLSLYLMANVMGQGMDNAAERHRQSGYVLAEPVYHWAMFLRPTEGDLSGFIEELLFRYVKSRDNPNPNETNNNALKGGGSVPRNEYPTV